MPVSGLCGTPYYANDVGCSVGDYLDDFITHAIDSEAALNTALLELSNIYDANTTTPNYSPDTSSVNKTFVAPTVTLARGDYASLQPTEVTLPSPGALLDSTALDAIYAKARSRITRAFQKEIRDALESTGTLGLGLPTPTTTAATRVANQRSAEGISQAALEQAAQEGIWAREDIKTIYTWELQNFTSKWEVIKSRLQAEEDTLRSKIQQYLGEIQREAERRGWSQMQITEVLEEAKTSADTAIRWGQINLQKLMQVEEVIVRMKAAVFQGWLQQADLQLSFQGSQSVSTSVAE